MDNKKIKFAFWGTGDFAVKILEILTNNDFIPGLIITAPDKPKGRKMIVTPPPIKEKFKNYKIIQPENLSPSLFTNLPFDLFIVAEYGKIIPKEILNIPQHGSINVHPSLLPKFRGPSPMQSFILSEEKETGVTLILMDEKMDHGPIIAVSNFKPQPNIKYEELEGKLAQLGGDLLAKTIPNWLNGGIKPKEQNHNVATFTKKISKNDGLIKLTDSPESIEKKLKALTPWPGIYFFTKSGKRIIITDAEIKENKLTIKKVKPEGKKEMMFSDFLKGNKTTD